MPPLPTAYLPTEEQKAVIEAQHGTTLVLAAVGSGKTSTLCHRVARTIVEGVSAENILALTFTNRAAKHLRHGLSRIIPVEDAAQVHAATFHGICHHILRAESEAVGLSERFAILDEEECIAILEELRVPDAKNEFYAFGKEAADVPSRSASVAAWFSGSFSRRPWARSYCQALSEREAVDFSGLVLLTRALLTRETTSKRWAERFDALLIDEVQDTHLSEYEVIRALASNARSLCLVGDLDQTIYSWRGSQPAQLIAALERDFSPVRRLHMSANFRSTRRIIEMANRLANRMPERTTIVAPHPSLPEGEPVQSRCYAELSDEAHNIARCCAEAIEDGVPEEEIAVLLRGKREIKIVSSALSALEVPHVTADQLRFFRHAEIADCLAITSLVHDRADEARMRRVARRMIRGLDAQRARRLSRDAHSLGLRLCDLVREEHLDSTDPLAALETTRVVILDTETTGIDADRDEVIEIAAMRLIDGMPSDRPEDRMSVLIRNTRPVGSSEAVHRISDERLQTEGVPARAAFSALASFIGDDPIAGHNVGFDHRMLEAHGARVGFYFDLSVCYDTLSMARRLIESPRHDLSTLVRTLSLSSVNTHRALDDVLATAELAQKLKTLAEEGRTERLEWLEANRAPFSRLRKALDGWAAMQLRPAALIRELNEKLMRHKVARPQIALPRLDELAHRVDAMDIPDLTPERAMQQILATSALMREGDSIDRIPGIRILTMHQSKGLEFSHVFLPCLVQNTIPSFHAVKSGEATRISEERRLLYVAMTRAKARLYLSWHAHDSRGYSVDPSEFLGELLGN